MGKSSMVIIGLLTLGLLTSGCDSGSMVLESDMSLQGGPEGLIETVTLDNGFKVEFIELADDEMLILGTAATENISQMESGEIFNDAIEEGMKAVNIYEELTGREAPAKLAEVAARVRRMALENDLFLENNLELPQGTDQPESADWEDADIDENGMTPLWSASGFKNYYCYNYSCRCYNIRKHSCWLSKLSAYHWKDNMNAQFAVVNAYKGPVRLNLHSTTSRCSGCWSNPYSVYIRDNSTKWAYSSGSKKKRGNYINNDPWDGVIWSGKGFHAYSALWTEDCSGEAPFCYPSPERSPQDQR